MTKEYLPTPAEIGTGFEPVSAARYADVPVFEATKEFNPTPGADIKWNMLVPNRESLDHSPNTYTEDGKRGRKLSKEGKRLAKYNWNTICLATDQNPSFSIAQSENGSASVTQASIDNIKTNASAVIEKLENDQNTQQDFVGLMKKSFEARISYMERVKFWQEMDASNSPWTETMEAIGKEIYGGLNKNFVRNFSTAAVTRVKERISEHVENYVSAGEISEEDEELVRVAYENRLANHINQHLKGLGKSERETLREQRVYNLVDNILSERRFTEQDSQKDTVRGYMNKTLEGVLNEVDERKISTITATDIVMEPETLQTEHETQVIQEPDTTNTHDPQLSQAEKTVVIKEVAPAESDDSYDTEEIVETPDGEGVGLDSFRSKVIQKPSLSEKLKAEANRAREEIRRRMKQIPDWLKTATIVTTVGVTAWLGARGININQHDILAEFSNGRSPVTTPASRDIIAALNISDEVEDEETTTAFVPVQTKRSDVSSTPTAASTSTPTAKPTQTDTPTPEPTTTPTPTPEPPLYFSGIDLSVPKRVVMAFNLVGLGNQEIEFTPVVYEDNFTTIEVGEFQEQISPGNETVAVDSDNYGNTIMYCHSGYSGSTPLECESLRQRIEGGGKDRSVPMRSENERIENLENLVGSTITMEQDGVETEFVVTTAGYVPNDKKDEFDRDNQKSLDTLIETTGNENSPFNVYKDENNNAIFLTFCGWGERNQDNWWVWSRYVLALEPVDNAQEQVQEVVENQTAENSVEDAQLETSSPESVAELPDIPYVTEVQTIANVINDYSEEHPYDGGGDKPETGLGEYIKASSWYQELGDKDKFRLENILDLINDKTYTYRSAGGVYQAIQCIDYEGLLYNLAGTESPTYNAPGVESTYPGDAVDRFYSTSSISIDTLTPGSVIITPKHIAVVIYNSGGTVWITDANRNKDGKVEIFSVSSAEELASILGQKVHIK